MPGELANKKALNGELVESWARQWHRQLHRFLARRLPPNADTQDLAQEVYLRLLRFDGAELVRHPQAYLCKIAAHVACEWQREARQRKPHSSEALEELETELTLEEALDLEHRRRLVREAMCQLPASMRTALTLQYRDGLSYEEIAREMGVTRRMARRYIEEGYARLREQLITKEQGGQP
jgi:RNA polymerase sigma-70 factor (ECF subfamily)